LNHSQTGSSEIEGVKRSRKRSKRQGTGNVRQLKNLGNKSVSFAVKTRRQPTTSIEEKVHAMPLVSSCQKSFMCSYAELYWDMVECGNRITKMRTRDL